MAATNLKSDLLTTLQNEVGAGVDLVDDKPIVLTPYLALACALLYMMASDGELEAQESSQLQAVLGGDQAVLAYALRYVQSTPVEQFFVAAKEVLSVKDKWCILTNVCDALLSDGRADAVELALFSQMAKAFEVRESQFESYFKVLALKNDKSVLGKYTGVREERQPMTPHFALAIALLYMLTADGSIGAQEVGQLEAVIGEFEGLQNIALKYVRAVKLKQFLDESSALLRPEQKIYILVNVCDCMLSDGEVAHLEDKLFLSVLTAFGFTEKTFARYWQVLETKNIKPFSTREFKNRVTHERITGSEDEKGISFTNDLSDAANQGAWNGEVGDAAMGEFIERTMSDNIQSLSGDLGEQSNVAKIGLNATDGLNLQKIGDEASADNRQQIDPTNVDQHLEKLETSADASNRQILDVQGDSSNRQVLEGGGSDANRQAIDLEVAQSHREALSPEARLQNIHEVVEVVSDRLDRFETDHFRFLQIGRAYKFSDSFALLEEDDSGLNRQLVDASYLRMGVHFEGVQESQTTVASEGSHDDVPLAQGATADAPVSDLAKIPVIAAPVANVAPSVEGVEATKRKFQRDGQGWLWRGRGFVYVQLVVASMTLAFASPIETQGLKRREVIGPLLIVPALVPAVSNSEGEFDSQLLPVSSVR